MAQKLVEQFPEDGRSWLVLAGMQANQNDNIGARASNKKALELVGSEAGALAGLAANNMFVRYHLAIAEEGLGNTDAARALFAEVAGFNFNSVAFALTRADSAARAEL